MKPILYGLWAWCKMTTVWWEGLSPKEQAIVSIPLSIPLLVVTVLMGLTVCLWLVFNLVYLPMFLMRWLVNYWLGGLCPEKGYYE